MHTDCDADGGGSLLRFAVDPLVASSGLPLGSSAWGEQPEEGREKESRLREESRAQLSGLRRNASGATNLARHTPLSAPLPFPPLPLAPLPQKFHNPMKIKKNQGLLLTT